MSDQNEETINVIQDVGPLDLKSHIPITESGIPFIFCPEKAFLEVEELIKQDFIQSSKQESCKVGGVAILRIVRRT